MNIYELKNIEEFEDLNFWQLKKIEELTENNDGCEEELFELQQEKEELQYEKDDLQDEKDNLEIRFCFLNNKIDEIQEEIERCIEIKEHKEIKEKLSYILKRLQEIRDF